jgi:hypothetical protein
VPISGVSFALNREVQVHVTIALLLHGTKGAIGHIRRMAVTEQRADMTLQNRYRVFISHGSDDQWIAAQIAKNLSGLGADTFLDETSIPKGANFKQIIHREIASSDEVVALFTPWSALRSWVWTEIGAAWILDKPIVAVFYRMELDDLEKSGQGKGMLEDINVLQLNDIELYFAELGTRVKGTNRV